MRKDSIEIYHIAIAVLVAGIVIYGLFQARVLLGVFHIDIETPIDGATYTEALVPVVGSVKHAESISLNGRTIPVNRDNSFAESYLLSPGYNEVVVTAVNKFGRTESKVLRLYLEAGDKG